MDSLSQELGLPLFTLSQSTIEIPFEFTLYASQNVAPLSSKDQVVVLEEFRSVLQQTLPTCLATIPSNETLYEFKFFLESVSEFIEKKKTPRLELVSFKFRITFSAPDPIFPKPFFGEDSIVTLEKFSYGTCFEIIFDEIRNKYSYTGNFFRITLGALALNSKIKRMKPRVSLPQEDFEKYTIAQKHHINIATDIWKSKPDIFIIPLCFVKVSHTVYYVVSSENKPIQGSETKSFEHYAENTSEYCCAKTNEEGSDGIATHCSNNCLAKRQRREKSTDQPKDSKDTPDLCSQHEHIFAEDVS